MTITILSIAASMLAAGPTPAGNEPPPVIEIGTDLQPMFDEHLVDSMIDVRLEPGRPRDEGVVFRFDRPWEGPFSGYATVIHDRGRFLLYYRGLPEAGGDGTVRETTCLAVSADGRRWSRPVLGLHEIDGTDANNVILADAAPVTHNFSPFLDTRPGVDPDRRFKALGGSERSGLLAYASPDGVHWSRIREAPVLVDGMFDSQNVAFWSEAEQCYCCYFRTWSEGGYRGFRTVSRSTSPDFLDWSESVPMRFGEGPLEHLYTNQTHPYYRSPGIYVGIAARFMPGRQVVDDAAAASLGVDPKYYRDCSDAVLLTSRGGDRYDRSFREAVIRPGIGLENWVSRSNYPALNVVPSGPEEMSVYVNQNYAQPTAELRRYSMRVDGLASMRADAAGGGWTTRPLMFAGDRLELNFATSAAGGIRVTLLDVDGSPIPGYGDDDAIEQIGNEIDRTVMWRKGPDVGDLAGHPVRIRFEMQDADLFAFRFRNAASSMDAVVPVGPASVELRSVERIWEKGPHNAFTDLLEVDGRLFCAFREGDSHVGGSNGRIRVIMLEPGDAPVWRSVVLLEEPGVDLRDPKLSLAPDGRIMVGFGGSIYEGATLRSCRSRVAFLDRQGGRSGPVREMIVDDRIRTDHDWLWRTTWHEGVGYGVVYQASPDASGIHLVSTVDGVNWDRRASLPVSGTPNEATIRFASDGSMRALIRREGGDGRAWFGAAAPPFDRWSFTPLPESLGGPDFIGLGEDRWLVGGRRRGVDGPSTVLGIWDESADGGWTYVAVLPSGGDTSYPGFVRIDDEILVSYYSSHEGKTAIHLARLGLEPASSAP